jgi:hypothetical protein
MNRPRLSCSIIVILTFLVSVSLSACAAPAQALPTATQAIIRTILPSTTPRPSDTPRPTFTAPASPTATVTPTPTPTPDQGLAQAKLVGLAWMQDYNMLLSFDFPGPVQADAYRVTLEDHPYPCQILAQYPNRLYCIGPGAKVLAYAHVQVFQAGSETAGYDKQVWIPYFNNDYSQMPYNPTVRPPW